MNLDLSPIKIDINIESLSLNRGAFYTLCFITENDTAPRNIEVTNLKELLDYGFTRDSLAYNFCVGVFAQQKMNTVIIRSKKTTESYEQAFSAGENFDYYFVVIESKDDLVISNFNDYLNDNNDNKLQFYSSNTNPILGKKLVHYTQKTILPQDISIDNKINIVNQYINKAYKLGYITPPVINISDYQTSRLAYPEAAWIASCGNLFPSTVQWLYKSLAKVDVNKSKVIPNLSNTSNIVLKDKVTVGSGMTTDGILIHEQVSLDWVKWAIGRNVWSTLYRLDKVNQYNGGVDVITNDIKAVLEVAVEQSIFSSYKITEVSVSEKDNKVSIRFNAMLTQSIMSVEVNGSLYY